MNIICLYACFRTYYFIYIFFVTLGTGSDWSTEELDFDKELDSSNKIDWNEDFEREYAFSTLVSLPFCVFFTLANIVVGKL